MGYGDDRTGLHADGLAGLLLTFASTTNLSLVEMASVGEIIAADCRYEIWAYGVTKETPGVEDNIKWDVVTIADKSRADCISAIEAYSSSSQQVFVSVLDKAARRMNERRLSGI